MRGLAGLGRAAANALARGLTYALGRRGLCLGFLLVMLLVTRGGWVRPPISADLRSFQIPLLGGGPGAATLLYGPRPFLVFSPGTILFMLILAGAVVVLGRPARFPLLAGLMMVAVLGGMAAATLNQPELVELMDQQLDQRGQLIAVLAETVDPPLRITDSPRVEDTQDPMFARGTLLRGVLYVRTQRLLVLALPVVACLLALRGPLGRRLRYVGSWCVVGVLFAGVVALTRLSAEWSWVRAVQADQRGDTATAERLVQSAINRCPAFARLERTWTLLGRLDYRRGRTTPAARLFHAQQLAGSRELPAAIAEMTELVRLGEPTPLVARWLANLESTQAFAALHHREYVAADDGWQRAYEHDPVHVFRPLLCAAVRARAQRDTPEQMAASIDPLLARLTGDRTLRAALLALLGDQYFDAGQFAEARARYAQSMKVYSLPKQINYRAQRGLYGM